MLPRVVSTIVVRRFIWLEDRPKRHYQFWWLTDGDFYGPNASTCRIHNHRLNISLVRGQTDTSSPTRGHPVLLVTNRGRFVCPDLHPNPPDWCSWFVAKTLICVDLVPDYARIPWLCTRIRGAGQSRLSKSGQCRNKSGERSGVQWEIREAQQPLIKNTNRGSQGYKSGYLRTVCSLRAS